MDYRLDLENVERDARALRARYARDLLVRAAVAIDLAIRRFACRALLACQ